MEDGDEVKPTQAAASAAKEKQEEVPEKNVVAAVASPRQEDDGHTSADDESYSHSSGEEYDDSDDDSSEEEEEDRGFPKMFILCHMATFTNKCRYQVLPILDSVQEGLGANSSTSMHSDGKSNDDDDNKENRPLFVMQQVRLVDLLPLPPNPGVNVDISSSSPPPDASPSSSTPPPTLVPDDDDANRTTIVAPAGLQRIVLWLIGSHETTTLPCLHDSIITDMQTQISELKKMGVGLEIRSLYPPWSQTLRELQDIEGKNPKAFHMFGPVPSSFAPVHQRGTRIVYPDIQREMNHVATSIVGLAGVEMPELVFVADGDLTWESLSINCVSLGDPRPLPPPLEGQVPLPVAVPKRPLHQQQQPLEQGGVAKRSAATRLQEISLRNLRRRQ